MYERVGFQPEALLTDYLIDPWDETHDLVIMSCDVARAASTLLAEELALLDARAVEETVTTSTGHPEVEVVAASIEIYAGAAASVYPVEEFAATDETTQAESADVAAFAEPAGVCARRREEPALAAAAAMKAVDALAAFAENDASFEATVRPVEESVIVVSGLTEAAAVAAFAGISAPSAVAQTTADDQARGVRLAVGSAHSWRVRLMDAGVLRVVAAIAVFAAVSSAVVAGTLYALESRGGGNESQVLPASMSPTGEGSARALPASFTGSSVGSGRMVIPAAAPRVSLQVSLDSATVTGTWFWCFESSFGLSWQEHYCSATGVLDAQTGSLVTKGVVSVDPAWPADAVYFIQMYCESDCAWQATVRQQ